VGNFTSIIPSVLKVILIILIRILIFESRKDIKEIENKTFYWRVENEIGGLLHDC
jgi:hypothetical protein